MERGFKWMGDYEITADEVLGGIAPKANKLEQAKRMLWQLLNKNKYSCIIYDILFKIIILRERNSGYGNQISLQ